MSLKFDFTGRMMAAFGFVAGAGLARAGNKLAEIILEDAEIAGKNKVYVWDEKTKFDEVILSVQGKNEQGLQANYSFSFESINGNYSNIFATPPMMSFKRAKKLTITPIDNSDIEVVERYATEPYSIEWRGLLIDMENHNFPLDKMETLNQIFEHNGVWDVASEILQAVGINSVFIQDVSFDFVEGYEDTISYTMTLRAIKPLEYQLLKQ
jgi:hypothetical protein